MKLPLEAAWKGSRLVAEAEQWYKQKLHPDVETATCKEE
jgi:hypothetical protein